MNRSKSETTRSIDIVNGGLWKNILMFAIPLAVSSVLQQLFNSVDVAVVGKFARQSGPGSSRMYRFPY